MLELFLRYKAPLRFGLFVAVIATLAAWKIVAPRCGLLMPKVKRWLANVGILIINTVLVRAVLPAPASSSAKVAKLLAGAGRREIQILEGGREQWDRLGLPVDLTAKPADSTKGNPLDMGAVEQERCSICMSVMFFSNFLCAGFALRSLSGLSPTNS